MVQREFLEKASAAAQRAGHIFPQHAACEAALESGWGSSELATKANNLFGQKQSHPPQGETLLLPTREFLHSTWTTVQANWKQFASWDACFADRMALLRRLGHAYPNYGAALQAHSGDEFIREVSKSWSTDPQRAEKVLQVFAEFFGSVAEATMQVA